MNAKKLRSFRFITQRNAPTPTTSCASHARIGEESSHSMDAEQNLAECTLKAQGFAATTLPFLAQGRLLTEEPFPLGSSIAAKFGHLYIQDASSMLPSVALYSIIEKDGKKGEALSILDMCSSPGGKSSLLADLLPDAFILSNEPAQKRLANLRRNLETLNHLNCATCSYPGEDFPLPSAGALRDVEEQKEKGLEEKEQEERQKEERQEGNWIPAYAGMTGEEDAVVKNGIPHLNRDDAVGTWQGSACCRRHSRKSGNPDIASCTSTVPMGNRHSCAGENPDMLAVGQPLKYSGRHSRKSGNPDSNNSTSNSTFAGFDYILLDPPCSGWGTVEKNPKVLELWQGEKLEPLVRLQKQLIYEAARLLKPGGSMVYSTCTLNPDENEAQFNFALHSPELDGVFEAIKLTPFPGFTFTPTPNAPGTLLVSMESEMGQGFYIAALHKRADAPTLPKKTASLNLFTGISWEEAISSGLPNIKGKAAQNVRGFFAGLTTLPPKACASALTRMENLPEGRIIRQNGKTNFYHKSGLNLLPATFIWRGFPLGGARISPTLHCLMPPLNECQVINATPSGTNGLPEAYNAQSADEVNAILSGQSFAYSGSAPEVGLYYMGLPLCRLQTRQGRMFLSK